MHTLCYRAVPCSRKTFDRSLRTGEGKSSQPHSRDFPQNLRHANLRLKPCRILLVFALGKATVQGSKQGIYVDGVSWKSRVRSVLGVSAI
jgi:hypothetical protein